MDRLEVPRSRGVRVTPLRLLLLAAVALMPLLVFACGNDGDTSHFSDDASGSQATSSSSSGAGGSGDDGGLFDASPSSPLAIMPQNPVLKLEVPTSGQTIQFSCIDTGTQLPADVTWSLSSAELGTIDASGLFTPNGKRTGEVTVKCATDKSDAQTKLKIFIHASDDQGGLTQAQKDQLKGPPGQSDSSWQFQYPYDKTVFPRGILAPEIQLTSGSALGSAFYVQVLANDFEYEGFFGASGTNTQLVMSQDAWEALTNAGGGSKVEVRVSKLANNQKYGPIYRTWYLANGKLHGTIYYNTYDSPLAGNGAMMRIKGNSPTPEVLVGNCTVCHSISSDGSTAAAANHDLQFNPAAKGGTFDLTGGQLDPPVVWSEGEKAAFAALYPKNGEVLVINGAPGSSWPPNTPGTGGPGWLSELRTKNGTIIPASGIEMYYAQSPVFSHDGTMLAFNDRSPSQSGGFYPGVLALMSYDAVTQKFSNYQVLATPPPGRQYAWPAFTPDNKYVVYQDGVGEDLATWQGNTGKLFAVNVQTKQNTYLMNLNGDGYMPGGSRDENKNYEPTIAPIASGGYFWLMFTSRRTYGNKLTGTEDVTKRLWVSAFDPNAADGVDPTHPAFYISGQELTSGNSRGFWALDPCKQDGADCESGDECCNGFCNPKGDPPEFVCGPPDGMCSDEFEACSSNADCCDPALQCIGGICTQLPPT